MTVAVDPVIGRLGPFVFGWYGVIMAVGILLGLWIVARATQAPWPRLRITRGDSRLCPAVLGSWARVWCTSSRTSDYFRRHPGEIIGVGMVGLAIYGVIAGSLLGAVAYSVWRKLPLLKVLDCGALAFPVAQLIGKSANIINGDTWGRPPTCPGGSHTPTRARTYLRTCSGWPLTRLPSTNSFGW